MKVNGSYTFAVPRDVLWPMLLDPHVLASVMPGCEKLERVAENEYTGLLKVKVGPVQGDFIGKIVLSDITAPESYNMVVDGKGAPGFMKGTGSLRLEAEGDSTILHYEGDAQVGGRLASVGQRLLDSSAKAIIRTSLEGLENQVAARSEQTGSGVDETAVTPSTLPPSPPTQTEFALGVAKHMVEEMFAEENQEDLIRKMVIAGGILLALFVFLEWFAGRIAAKTARKMK